MATKVKQWADGSSVAIQYDGQGDGQIIITSDPNSLYEARSMQITVETTNGSPKQTKKITINQAAKQRIDLSAAVVTASNQTYSGSAKTPTPTVTLNGSTVPSSGYDVSYSNNTNAGTANITITGKGDYTGTATGTFTINQATGVVTTAPTARDVTYTGSSQYLVTAGSGTGTMYYRYKLSTSSSWSSWSTTRPSRTNAGTYNIEYYAAASSDGNFTQSATGSLNVEMKKAAPSYTAPTINTGKTYNGKNQMLCTAGNTSDGTIYYKLSSTDWLTGVPYGLNAGYYTVWWKIVGDSNHTDKGEEELGICIIAKASRSIYWISYPSTLNEGDSDSLSAYVSAGSGDGSISFSSSNSNVASISGSTVYGVGEGSCYIYASVSEGTNYLSASTYYSLSVYGLDYVDLGLPSGTLWAKCNLGASSPEEAGIFCSWANIDGHYESEGYIWGTDNSIYNNTPGHQYHGDISPTDASHDIAYYWLGSPWHMPTADDVAELYDNTDKQKTTYNGVSGWKFMKPSNHNVFIFIPLCGNGWGDRISDKNSVFGCWTSTDLNDTKAYDLYAKTSGVYRQDSTAKGRGFNIRPVR